MQKETTSLKERKKEYIGGYRGKKGKGKKLTINSIF